MGSQSQSLLGATVSPITEPLQALQRGGITLRMWKRLGKDPAFGKAAAEAIARADIETRGEPFRTTIHENETAEILWEKLTGNPNFSHGTWLKKDWRQRLSKGGREDLHGTVEKHGWSGDLFLIPIYRHMTLDEVLEELDERWLLAADTREALAFSTQHNHQLNGDRRIYALRSFSRKNRALAEDSILYLSRLPGGPSIGLKEVSGGFPGGSVFLARELPDLREH